MLILLLTLRVVPLFTIKSLLIVFVLVPENVTLPAIPTVRLLNVIAPLPPPTAEPFTVTVGDPPLVPITPEVVFVRFPVMVIEEFKFKVVPVPTVTFVATEFVPLFVNVIVPVPEVVRAYIEIAPVVPPPILPVPVIVIVGVPE